MNEVRHDLDQQLPNLKGPWVLIIGGITPEGNRRARRASRKAAQRGHDVVWLDGFEERDPTNPPGRQLMTESDAEITVLGFREAERRGILNRWSIGEPRASDSVANTGAEEIGKSYTPRNGIIPSLFRKLNHAVRGYLIWRILRPAIHRLADGNVPDPEAIVFGDELSLPTAWHTVRIWQQAPAGMELPEL